MINPFYNNEEKRLRAGVRLLVQINLMFFVLPIVQYCISSIVQSLVPTDLSKLILQTDSAQFIAVFISMAGTVLLCAKIIDRRRITDLGTSNFFKSLPDYACGFLLSTCCVALMLLVELALGVVKVHGCGFASDMSYPRFALGILDGLFACVMIGFHEELLRFYQIKNLSEGVKKLLPPKARAVIFSTIVASLYFGYLHKDNAGITPQAVSLLVSDGVFLSLSYIITGRAWLAFGFHAGWDFAEGNLFGFPVSGYPEKFSLLKIEQIGAPILTGGSFGPDGGLINFIMIIFGTLGILFWIKLRYKKQEIQENLVAFHKIF